MKLAATVELTRGDLSLIATALEREWRRTSQLWSDGNRDGWYDAKAKERVALHLQDSKALLNSINKVIKELDNG